MRLILLILLCNVAFFLGLAKLHSFFSSKEPVMEIYTLENIYYVKDLTIANEVNSEVIEFDDLDSMYEYISIITVTDNQKGYDCLNPEYPRTEL